MAEGRRRRRRHGQAAAMDCIGGLPDELLHEILLRLKSARAAARTSVLSRRWRHVWAHLPELVFDGNNDTDFDSAEPPAASLLNSVDGALRAYSAPTVEVLDIYVPYGPSCPSIIPARRVRSWLRFASRRLVRTLRLDVPWLDTLEARGKKVKLLELPTMDRTQKISLSLGDRWRLRIRPAAGVFVALTDLTIDHATMEGRVLEALVSSQCPCLRDLSLDVTLAPESDISLRSDSLETLSLCVDNIDFHWVEIVAPKMEKLYVPRFYAGARISAPKLAELVWEGNTDAFGYHIEFVDASRHLRLLELRNDDISAFLMKRFDEVDLLRLEVSKKIVEYESFLNDTNNLPKCGTLLVYLFRGHCHGFAPTMLHLLRKCKSVRNFKVHIISRVKSSTEGPCCQLSCPCRLPENCKADDGTLDSLEEVQIYLTEGSHDVVEFVKQLSQCHTAILKKVVIDYYTKSVNEMFCAQVRGVCRPNIKVEFNCP